MKLHNFIVSLFGLETLLVRYLVWTGPLNWADRWHKWCRIPSASLQLLCGFTPQCVTQKKHLKHRLRNAGRLSTTHCFLPFEWGTCCDGDGQYTVAFKQQSWRKERCTDSFCRSKATWLYNLFFNTAYSNTGVFTSSVLPEEQYIIVPFFVIVFFICIIWYSLLSLFLKLHQQTGLMR